MTQKFVWKKKKEAQELKEVLRNSELELGKGFPRIGYNYAIV